MINEQVEDGNASAIRLDSFQLSRQLLQPLLLYTTIIACPEATKI